ncbi:hypothetical protein [Anoxybacteroides amylolyticum]|uniref:Uncharacterized protein n=1 Tax=Anoxybacteroides amylolyticum TaxID=294699 RepID=A0A160F110_9BACL|nr:hypothetical protein [Anoxybacillus amylolyticus]ANB59787.1 hypothetical protein GFC30_2130 [Anoxybacillus amylolyticus]
MLPNFEEFYPIAVIPMGESDRATFHEMWTKGGATATHWLIALEGIPLDHVYHWKVIVYPASTTVAFYFDCVRFSSPPLCSFHEASSLASDIKLQIKTDEFLAKKQLSLQMK